MPQNLDFNNIRPLGSLNEGFEELVCQLAHRMNVPGGKKFVRNGRPDGGAECYWELDNGGLWMWQAKFFVSTPGASQFEQISDSVKTALRLHRNVKKFFIAIPQDLPNDGKDETKSAKKRYDEKLVQWHKIDGAENTEFVFWGKHELLNELSKKENEGLVYFWFNKTEFTEKVFENQNKKAIDDLGARYTPALNVELDIAKTFNGLSRDSRFEDRCKNAFSRFKQVWRRIHPAADDLKADEYQKLERIVSEIIDEESRIVFDGIEQIPFDRLKAKIESASERSQAFIKYLEKKQKPKNEIKDINSKIVDYSYTIRDTREFYYESIRLANYLGSPECLAANIPFILLGGEAGVGKSHLLADVVNARRKDKRYSLFFLGQHFNAYEDPWTQIFKQLKFQGSDEEFLQALEAKAESSGQRIIIFIDALNEGGGKELWNSYVASFINQIKDHPWLGLVMSFRSTYFRALFGGKEPEGVISLTHRGFENRSFDAIKRFFKNSNISLPSVPLLLPEFKNPLFLKLFCDGLHKNGLSKIDEGMQGISSVINLFIEGVEKALSSPKKKDYMPELHIVRKAINALIDYQVDNLVTEVPLREAFVLTDRVKTDKFSDGELLYELVSYGVLARDMRYRGKDEYEEVVFLSYERFNDFLTAQRLLEVSQSAEAAVKKLIKTKNSLSYFAGIVEAFAIILPERVGREIYEVLPEFESNDIIVDSVIKSLLWRKKSTIDKKLVGYFNKGMTHNRYINFISTLIQVGPTVGHPFNAEYLHKNLMKWKMAERDYRWSTQLRYISNGYDNPVDNLITWTREDFEHVTTEDESKFLTAIVLGWFTASMDRRIRDCASKGLIALVRNDVGLMLRILDAFDGVDDPYVVERVYAAAYGCALLSNTPDKLDVLAKSVYKHIFDVDGEVYPNAMVRDYAKGVIEYVLTIYPDLELGNKTYIPPYKSSFHEMFPTDQETKAYSKRNKNGEWLTPGIDAILESMVTEYGYTIYGDFGRYVFQRCLDAWDFDPQKLSNLAVKWIIERYGYKEEWFGDYDKEIGYGRMRQVASSERVGKKYQWIALYEMLARLSDNYPMHDPLANDKDVTYNGTWEPYIRDFDPTMLVTRSISAWYEPESRYWWNSVEYADWNCPRAEWVKKYDDLPDPTKLIESVDHNGVRWLALEAFPSWEEPHEKDAGTYRDLWYQIRSYIVDEGQFADFALWALDQNFTGRWMPEVSDRYEMFGREYYWSPAYDYYEEEGLTKQEIYDKEDRKKIADVELPCVKFLWEAEYDYSKPGTVSYLKPSKSLFEGMGMRYSEKDGELMDADGNPLCFDARVHHNSHGYFLVRKDALLQYLKSNHKRILWVLIGEKNLMGAFIQNRDWLGLSGAYYLDPDEEVRGSMAAYLEGKPLKKPKTNKQKIDILENYQSTNEEKVFFDNEARLYSVFDIKNMLLKEGKIRIDTAMSDDTWDARKRSKYIESLLAGLPLTTITASRGNDGKLNVIDGGQRISAIRDFLIGRYSLRDLNLMDLYEDCYYEGLPSKAKSRLIYTNLPFNVITSSIDEKTRAEIYNRLNTGIHQISEKNRRLLQYKGRMTDVMEALIKDRSFTSLTKNSRKTEKDLAKEDIALRMIVDYVITQENDSMVRYLNENYKQQLSDAAKFINESCGDECVGVMRARMKGVLKTIVDVLGKDVAKKLDNSFSLPLMEILFIAFLFSHKDTSREVLKDIVYKFIEDNAYKISYSGNDSTVKFRERLMLALELSKLMNI